MPGGDYAIWVVALLFYLGDAARLLSRRELLLVEAGRGRFAVALTDNPFTLGGRVLAFGPVWLPYRAVLVAPWGGSWSDGASAAAELARVRARLRALGPVRVVAVAGGALLFGLGPVLTRLLGPDAAVAFTAAIVYPTVLVGIAALWWRRRALGLATPRCAWLSIEILVCPAFLPNLVRKITAARPVDADALQILVATGSGDEELVSRLERRAEEILNDGDADAATASRLRAYVAAARAAVTEARLP